MKLLFLLFSLMITHTLIGIESKLLKKKKPTLYFLYIFKKTQIKKEEIKHETSLWPTSHSIDVGFYLRKNNMRFIFYYFEKWSPCL